MKRRTALISSTALVTALLLGPPAAQAAENDAEHTFGIAAAFDDAVAWYEENRQSVYRASNCRVVRNRGEGELEVVTRTPIGEARYRVQESSEKTTNEDDQRQAIYRLTYVRNVRGRVAGLELTVTMTEVEPGTVEIHLDCHTEVTGAFVSRTAVRNVQEDMFRDCERYIRRTAPLDD